MRLSDEERSTLLTIAESLARAGSVTALCAYGSKVAGYSRPDSDYDIIVVLKRFREGVRYKYVDEPVPASALLVDEQFLLDDAKSSYLGEFVAGRLLNVYDAIAGEHILRSAEVDYKRRVMVESLLELSADFGDFAKHLVIPFDYFLFAKLNRRAAIYPPALYSYVSTYTCPAGASNRASSIEGFASASKALSASGLVKETPSGVRMNPEKLRGDAFTKVESLFALATRGVTQYAVHGYAGRVGLSVVTREAQSKLKRVRDAPRPLEELARPRTMLALAEGALIADASLLESQLAGILGFTDYTTSERYLGDPYSTTKVLVLKSRAKDASVVVKNYSDVRSLKWAFLGVWASAVGKFSMSPSARLEREYRMTGALRQAGVLVPKIIAVAPEERVVVKEYIEGPTLASLLDRAMKGSPAGVPEARAFGSLLGRVHKAGISLGDAKASNVIVAHDGLFLTDLEQSTEGGDSAWDIAEFLYYTSKLSVREEGMEKVGRVFLEGYAETGDRAAISAARSPKYFRPFQPFLTPGMSKMLKELMASFG